MNKLELKKNAIESLNASGSLFEKEQYKEALAMAQRAWNSYFELQKLRDSDEDFTDLIYAARTQYNKCRTALDELEHEENNSLAKEYEEVLVWKEKGESGDYKAALKAADWFANPDHWALLNEKGVTSNDFLTYATHLYQSVVDHESIWPEYRALAAYNIGKMFMLPMYGNVNMAHALRYLQWAADQMLALEHRTDRLLMPILHSITTAATYTDDIALACRYAAIARENGSDMGIFESIARYGFRHKENMADELLEQMIADGSWEGMLIKGQNLLNDWLDDMENNDKDTRMADYAEMLSKYYDEHSDTEGSYELLGLVLMNYFIRNGMSFFDDGFMNFMQEGLDADSLWCRYYMGWICDVASDIVRNEGDTDRAEKMHQTALNQYCLAANKGHRHSIIAYLNMLKEDHAEPQLIATYEAIARQYDFKG